MGVVFFSMRSDCLVGFLQVVVGLGYCVVFFCVFFLYFCNRCLSCLCVCVCVCVFERHKRITKVHLMLSTLKLFFLTLHCQKMFFIKEIHNRNIVMKKESQYLLTTTYQMGTVYLWLTLQIIAISYIY